LGQFIVENPFSSENSLLIWMKMADPCFGTRNFEAPSNQDPSRKDTTAILQLNNIKSNSL
jgi:hypothetical protein